MAPCFTGCPLTVNGPSPAPPGQAGAVKKQYMSLARSGRARTAARRAGSRPGGSGSFRMNEMRRQPAHTVPNWQAPASARALHPPAVAWWRTRRGSGFGVARGGGGRIAPSQAPPHETSDAVGCSHQDATRGAPDATTHACATSVVSVRHSPGGARRHSPEEGDHRELSRRWRGGGRPAPPLPARALSRTTLRSCQPALRPGTTYAKPPESCSCPRT